MWHCACSENCPVAVARAVVVLGHEEEEEEEGEEEGEGEGERERLTRYRVACSVEAVVREFTVLYAVLCHAC